MRELDPRPDGCQSLRCSGGSPEGVPPGGRSHTACPVARPWLRKAPPGTEPPLQQKGLDPVGTLRRLREAEPETRTAHSRFPIGMV